MQRPVAFFDIDGTLFRSSLLIELVEQLIAAELFPANAPEQYQSAKRAWQQRQGTYEAYIEAVIATFIQHIKGVHYGAFADIGRQVVAVQRHHVYRFTRDLIADLRSQNYFLVAISQSPKTILDEFCAQHGFDKVYGRIYEIGPSDRFTGVVTDEHLIANKGQIVNRVFSQHPELARSDSYAVGDTEGDIALLEAVSHPICFNPNQTLYTHATRRGWSVVVERKDVIYHL